MKTERKLPAFAPLACASHPNLGRRKVLGALATLPALVHSSLHAQDNGIIKIGQSIALSGPLGELGQAMHQGAKACFAAVNAQGGIAGRKIELSALDDGYDVKRALANLDTFLADKATFALFNCMGTPMIEAMLPKVVETGIPFFAPFTGALLARPGKVRNIFNIRASYPEEAEQLVQHLSTIGIKRIAIVYQNNSFGKEVYEGARLAMEKHKLTGSAVVTVEDNASDAGSAATKLAESNPEAVLVGLAGKPTIEFVKAIRSLRKGLPLYALSIMGSSATIKSLGDDATGIAISQVMPLPTNTTVPVVREFQEAWKATGAQQGASHLALEGYVNARVFVEVLRRAGRGLTRSSFIENAWGLKRYDLGGFEIGFSEPGKNASRFVELTLVGRDGRFIR
ncbi:MAG: ABC transporter substrate-binding protein [Polaromonas sp.]|uniref:ABC transporter substrate-binding protein n=1 Tax=Polaromonas sp. TaxID=1869339 RepID=UPI00185E935F|nr:ABC transporter substrate-binding protein [Polaromonas sp.]MBA3595010.1 ABC transporter substrate-binding protein [Polaromonas sp.]